MQGQYTGLNSTVHPKEIQALNNGMKYVLIGTASILSVLGLTFSGLMAYGMYASWPGSNISTPSGTEGAVAATESSVNQSLSPVTTQGTASLSSNTAASGRASSKSLRNSVTTSEGKGVGVRAWD